MRSANPALKSTTFNKFGATTVGKQMTLSGTVYKTLILLIILMASSIYTWHQYNLGESVGPLIMIGVIGGLISALIIAFVPRTAPLLAPIYAGLEGLAVGGISASFESQFNGITMQAATLTFGTLFALLLAYMLRIIKVTHNFRLIVFSATVGIMLVYLTSFILGFFGISIPYLHSSGPVGIGISLFIVVIAALNLVLDFDFIEYGARQRVPKYMEWYGAFGLMVTLVWLYFEILHLLAKIRRN
ncbi:Bax inhibitor-1/YccA family protein [Fictibacillus phosphorivorans]|uniref:Bax inhibitor-1/YccA family protein n=1 Tax=Fictibacillus phosphorivorans TaxID=1221500 RepID=UPI00203E3D7F|nr:Bax inhibitor-1/YccA family protein [Fictibacillus phosphorivorans]MCM3720158.1 Bax inhibitor-1/YccA family protein [Fictibacillus phosphorivorans]MCM3777848.1 Bax inhibitor-1/YccA family protein [Fictibacillus phosphorivorans]